MQGGQQPEFQITPDPAKMLRAKVGVQDILDAVNHTNLIDSPGLLSRNHQLFLGLITAQVQNARADRRHRHQERERRSGSHSRYRHRGAFVAPAYTVVTANGKPAVLISINRQPDSNTVEVADEVHQEIEDSAPDSSRGRRAERFLRPVEHRAGIDRQRARRHHHRAFPRRASSSGSSCAIGAPRS